MSNVKISLLIACFATANLLAHPSEPNIYKCSTPAVTMLQEMSNTLMKEYAHEKTKLKDSTAIKSYAKRVTSNALLPSLDAEYMAKQIVGRYHWNNARSKDKQAFVESYKTLIAMEYSDFLLDSSNDENHLKFYPSRRNTPAQTIVLATVNTDRKKSTIGFYMHCVNNTVINNLPYKTWMIYDITLDDISYLDQFKVAVSSTVRNSGLPGLTKKINEMIAKRKD